MKNQKNFKDIPLEEAVLTASTFLQDYNMVKGMRSLGKPATIARATYFQTIAIAKQTGVSPDNPLITKADESYIKSQTTNPVLDNPEKHIMRATHYLLEAIYQKMSNDPS